VVYANAICSDTDSRNTLKPTGLANVKSNSTVESGVHDANTNTPSRLGDATSSPYALATDMSGVVRTRNAP
jgi:hypothetical protein